MISLKQLVKIIVAVPAIMGTVALMLMMVQIVLDVFLRTFIGNPMPLTTTIVANYHMIIVSFVPLALAEAMDRHISVEVVVQLLPKPVQYWLGIFTSLITVIVCAGLTWRMWEAAMKHFHAGTFVIEQEIRAITWPSYFALPIGFALFGIMVVIRIIATLRKDDDVFAHEDDADIVSLPER